MRLFYGQPQQDGMIHLDAEESKHLAKVLRLKEGKQVECIDGHGGRYICEISTAHPKHTELKILESFQEKENHGIHLVVAPTKNLSRWEWFLEKVTELGVDRITPIICEHSERKVLKRERQVRILLSAIKQSKKALMPQLDELQSLSEFLNSEAEGQKFIAHCAEDQQKKDLKGVFHAHEKAILLIGPEGDFSSSEIERLKQKGFQPVTLGKSRLRTETAALVACHSIHLLNA